MERIGELFVGVILLSGPTLGGLVVLVYLGTEPLGEHVWSDVLQRSV